MHRFSDPDASWGHRSAVSTRSHGGFYRYRIDMAVCTKTDLPIIPLRQTRDVERGADKPTCEHSEWRFAGSDNKRGASKWRCPTGECKPASVWIKATRLHPLIPRATPRCRKLYRGRSAVEREFGRLKHDWALAPLRVRGLDRVKLHADLTILAKLSCALSRTRAVPLAA